MSLLWLDSQKVGDRQNLTIRIEILVGGTTFVSSARKIPMCRVPEARRAGSAGTTVLGSVKITGHASVDMFVDKIELVRTLFIPAGAFGLARLGRVVFSYGEETDSQTTKH